MGSDQSDAAVALLRAKLAESLVGHDLTGFQAMAIIDSVMENVIENPQTLGALLDVIELSATEGRLSEWLKLHRMLYERTEVALSRLLMLKDLPSAIQREVDALAPILMEIQRTHPERI